jgi:hypothetical protein
MPHNQPHYEITRTDIAAIKACDKAGDHVYFQHQAANKNSSFIVCVKRGPERSPRNPFPVDRHHYIPCNVIVRVYGNGAGYGGTSPDTFNAYACPARSDMLMTLASFLKAGDVLALEWIGSNNNEVMTKAGLVRDDLHVLVQRGERRFDFFMVSHSCEPVARMVKANTVKA